MLNPPQPKPFRGGGLREEPKTPSAGKGKNLPPGSKTSTHRVLPISYLAQNDGPWAYSLQAGASGTTPAPGHPSALRVVGVRTGGGRRLDTCPGPGCGPPAREHKAVEGVQGWPLLLSAGYPSFAREGRQGEEVRSVTQGEKARPPRASRRLPELGADESAYLTALQWGLNERLHGKPFAQGRPKRRLTSTH